MIAGTERSITRLQIALNLLVTLAATAIVGAAVGILPLSGAGLVPIAAAAAARCAGRWSLVGSSGARVGRYSSTSPDSNGLMSNWSFRSLRTAA